MTTFGLLVSQVRQQLMGYALNQEAVAELAQDMTADDTSFTVVPGTASALSSGLVEIDDELIRIRSYDQQGDTAQVMGATYGRGAEGTVAAAHSRHALITTSPAFPKARIKEAINHTIQGMFPSLVVFGTAEITRSPVQYQYELPSDVSEVWYVTAQTVGPTKVWRPMVNWRFEPNADTTAFPTGKALQQLDFVTPGQAVRVVYAKRPKPLVNEGDELSATGFDERVADIVLYGTLKRLLPALEAGRLQQQAIEATERAQLVNVGSATKATGMYASLYSERLEEERNRMFSEAPNFATFQGS